MFRGFTFLVVYFLSFQFICPQTFEPQFVGGDLRPIIGIRSGPIKGMARGINNDELFIVGQGIGIHKSTDGGITIRGINPPGSHYLDRNYASVYVDGNNIALGGGAVDFGNSPGLQISTDGGETFTTVGLVAEYISSITGIPGSTQIYVATGNNGVYSFDGNTVTPFSTGLTITDINKIYNDPEDNEPFLVGGGNGLQWYDGFTQNWAPTSLAVPVLDITKGGGNTTYIVSLDKIYETTDNIVFNELPPLILGGDYAFTAIAHSTQLLYAASYSLNEHNTKLHVFNTGTNLWSDDSDGLPGNPGYPETIEIIDNYKFLGTTYGLYRGIVGGPWQNGTEEFTGGQITIANQNNYTGDYWAGSSGGEIFNTPNIDQPWNKDDNGLKGARVWEILHTEGGTGVVQSDNISWQVNAGEEWVSRNTGITLYAYRSAAYNPNDGTIAIAGLDGINLSSNYGLEWNASNYFLPVYKVHYSGYLNKFLAISPNQIVIGDGTNISIFIPNVYASDFAFNDDAVDFLLGTLSSDGLHEYDENGNQIDVLSYNGLGQGEYFQYINWSDQLDTWLCATEDKLYQYDYANGTWVTLSETDYFILNFNITKPLTDFSIRGGEEIIFVGTYGGGLYSNAPTTGAEEEENNVVTNYYLEQNHPNPFNPSTTISWQSPVSSHVSLKVYDVLGNEVATLVDEERQAGSHQVDFNANGISSGIYFYKLQSGSFVETKKMLLMK